MTKNLLFIASLAFAMTNAQTTVISENFDTFSALSGQGWTALNKSNPLGSTTTGVWRQGPADHIGPQSGDDTSYAFCNYSSATGTGTISNWLITPVVNLRNGDVISFYTMSGGEPGTYPDRLELRLSTAATTTLPSGTGASGATNLGSFTTLALTVNADLTATGYPFSYTKYDYTVSGLTGDVASRIAFRYYVTGGGTTGDFSDNIGVDTFSVTRPVMAVSDLSKSKLSVYPNPTSDYLKINSSEKVLTAEVFDVTGKNIPVKYDGTSLDVRSLPKGAYLVKLKFGAEVNVQKFIKE
ncbi:MAG: T9SS type A sorting domain-containing protein [Chryseobacterium sp.]|uniref:T9SS-dependent choice-of-anchor J family protein n=1 Tax=Epilithonimonas caeni TaxID=365343 RepID=UPI00040754BB|nr:choice-of-anchor J domain-containing protein [Epilithonimonas caeni]MPS74913.1 T9SS type A sorting domain-containing protein [Chryseobacterium sp.]